MVQAKAEISPTVGIGIGRMAQTPRFDTPIGVGKGGFYTVSCVVRIRYVMRNPYM